VNLTFDTDGSLTITETNGPAEVAEATTAP
jgi:hypothetical protein